MRYTSAGLVAALVFSLAAHQSAQADTVNDQNDARAFAVREAELAAGRVAAGAGNPAPQAGVVGADAGAREEEKPTRAKRALAASAGSDGLRALVARHAAANGVPFSLADAIVRVESRYNPRAAHAGNYGLMQIRHQTARGVGYSGSAGGLLDAETNARYGMKYLGLAYKLAGGDTCRTIMKYQSGHMAVRMSGANRAYCAKVRIISARS